MTTTIPEVIVGIDTHTDTHHVAVITVTGAPIADAQFPTTPAGYREIAAYITDHGRVRVIGVEGTNSYGAGLARYLRSASWNVKEVIRPGRQLRRKGKSDPLDAYEAARTVLAGVNLPEPKTSDGDAEAIRYLHATRRSAIKARSAAIVQLKSLLITAPDTIRDTYRHLNDKTLITRLAAIRPGPATNSVSAAVLHSLRHLARRYRQLNDEIAELDTILDELVHRFAPALHSAKGFGTITAAQLIITAGDNPERLRNEASFAALCGTSPIPASSGKTSRHRLNRGGDRQANAALYRIALVRMSCDPRTRTYVQHLTSTGKSTKEALRCVKRAIAREAYQHLTNPQPVPRTDDLRALRKTSGKTLTEAAQHFNTWPARIAGIETGKHRDDQLANNYRTWLSAA